MNNRISERDDPFGVTAFDVTADTMIALEAVCRIALTSNSMGATHYRVEPVEPEGDGRPSGATQLRLCWHDNKGAVALPFPLTTAKELAAFVASWLEKSATYGSEPDTDGSVKAGFRASDAYGSTFAIFAAEWIVYGK